MSSKASFKTPSKSSLKTFMKTEEPGINEFYAQVDLNNSYKLKQKVDTGSDTCTLTKMDWQKSQLAVKLATSMCILNKYGGGTIPNLGSATLKITHHGRSMLADFKIVDVLNSP